MFSLWLGRAAGSVLLATLAACGGGGGGSSGSGGSTTPGTSFRVGGTVSGLSGAGLILQNNGGNGLSVASDGIFLFTTALANGASYAVSVKTQPGSPTQICTVNNGSGTIAGANVSDVTVTCSTNSYKVGGTVSGLTGSGLVLQDNSGDDLTIARDGNFSFSTSVASGANYAVSVKTQPSSVPAQICKVTSGSGTVSAADVTGVGVSCAVPTPRYAYVANSGAGTVSAYTVNTTSGALTANGTAIGAGTNPNAIAIAPDGKFIYVANRSGTSPDFPGVSVYAIDASNGTLKEITGSPFAIGTQPIAIAIAPSGKFAYVANLALAASGNNINVLTIDATTGALTSTSSALAGNNPQSITIDPSGKFVYVANYGDGNVSAYTINATGALTEVTGSPFTAGTGPFSIAVDPTGKFVYVANYNSNDISAYTIDTSIGTAGALIAIGSTVAETNPTALAIDPSGTFVYAANNGSNSVSAYKINNTSIGTAGTLNELTGSPFAAGSGPSAITVAPNGKFAYVTDFNAPTVSAYSITSNTGTTPGALSILTPDATTGTQPAAIAILGQ